MLCCFYFILIHISLFLFNILIFDFGRENRFQSIHTLSKLLGMHSIFNMHPDVQIKSLNKCIDARGAKNGELVNFDGNAHCIRSLLQTHI